uniref:Pre-mRNA splicing Prp18-interacting factor n=1 Tax=Tanacetum cinerariifolium TaxID=118510 RepID=A0A6L2NBT7_TANCI|nr:hypothetical protein [Tanacetum cinerariifolium]
MTSFGYRLNPYYVIKECLSCGALYTRDFCCLKGNVEDKILVPKPSKNCARCAKCGHPVNGPYFQGCALLREKLEEDLVTYFQNFQNTSESSDDSTNVVNAPREPVVVKQDHGVNPPHIDECCCECGNALDGIYCQQCIFKSCGKGAYTGYNCPPKVPIISNPELCNQTMNNELPQTLPGFDSTCYFDKENSVPCVSKPNFVDESSNIFNPPPQPPIYYCEFCESNAQYGHYCTPQALFINPEPGYSQDFNFPQNIHDFQQHFDQFGDFHPQQYLCCENCEGPHETFQCQPTNEEYYHEQNSCSNSNSFGFNHCQPPQYTVNHPIFDDHNDLLTSRTTLMEQMMTLTSMCEMVCQIFQKKQEEKRIEEEQAAKARYNPTPLEAKDHFEIVMNSNDDISSNDDDSLYNENIEYVKASPHDSEFVSLEVAEIVIPEEEVIEDDNLREKLLNVHLLIANIEALKDNPAPSFEFLTKSSSTSPKPFLEETNTFHNSLLEFENFYFDSEEISSGSTTTHSGISLPDYEAFSFNNDHIQEINSGSTTTHSYVSLSEYDSFIFDLANDQFPSTNRSDFANEEFADELDHIISPPEYDRFYFLNFPDPGELISILNSGICENLSTTCVNLPIEDDHSPLLAYVVWIFLAYLTYPVIPLYLHPFGNEDTIFDPGITINRIYSFNPGLSHRCGAFKKFNSHRSHLNKWPMIINGKNTPILDVPLFHFYPP